MFAGDLSEGGENHLSGTFIGSDKLQDYVRQYMTHSSIQTEESLMEGLKASALPVAPAPCMSG